MPVRVVLVAAKELALAKTRLAPVLMDSERRALAEAMFRDVLAAACQARQAERVAVVTSDRVLLKLAWSQGAIGIDEGFPRGLNAAVALATSRLSAAGATALCTVLSDIPLVTGQDIDAVFDAVGAGKCAVLVPSRDSSGTNIIARSPADLIPTVFGRFSLVRHLDECRQRRVRCEVLRLARPALDLDQLEDLTEFVQIAGPSNTFNHLARLGIVSG